MINQGKQANHDDQIPVLSYPDIDVTAESTAAADKDRRTIEAQLATSIVGETARNPSDVLNEVLDGVLAEAMSIMRVYETTQSMDELLGRPEEALNIWNIYKQAGDAGLEVDPNTLPAVEFPDSFLMRASLLSGKFTNDILRKFERTLEGKKDTGALLAQSPWISFYLHEMKTPMFNMSMSCYIINALLKTNEPDKAERISHQVEVIYRNLQEVAALTEGRDMFKADEGEFSTKTEVIPAWHAIESAVQSYRLIEPTLHADDANYTPMPVTFLCRPETEGALLSLNPKGFNRAMRGILTNASKYGNPEGRGVAIVVHDVSEKEYPECPCVVITIRDFGDGMSQEQIENWGNYRMGHVRHVEGTAEGLNSWGYGSYIIRRYFRKMNGSIILENVAPELSVTGQVTKKGGLRTKIVFPVTAKLER